MQDKNSSSFTELSSSVMALCIVFILSSSIMFSVVSDKLVTAPMTSNSRYAVTFPALEYIAQHDDDAVIAIGSSIIQASVDGVCITDLMNTPDTNVFNLGISGATQSASAHIALVMREDGVEVDAILITDDPLFDPIKEW